MKHDYFDHWSSEMAYYLGWLWADGSIADKYCLQIGCVTSDEEILTGLMQAIGSSHKVIRNPSRQHRLGYNIAAYSKSRIYSKQMMSCLVEKHGILPKKTYLNLTFPKIEDIYLSHFIRGYFDGDGCICKSGDITSLSIVGTHDFMDGMQDAICKTLGIAPKLMHKNSKTVSPNAAWSVCWAKKTEVITLLEFMYSGKPCLTRKKKLADEYLIDLLLWCKNYGVCTHNGRNRLRLYGKYLGEYKTLKECQFARNYAHFINEGYPFPIPIPSTEIESVRQKEIEYLVDIRLSGNKTHQQNLKKVRSAPFSINTKITTDV
jgi:hypothetical protein